MVVLRYPQIRVSPNSGGSRIQPLPILGTATVQGCPDFATQEEAAYFNVFLVRALGGAVPAYADMAVREISTPKMLPFKSIVEEAAVNFAATLSPPSVPPQQSSDKPVENKPPSVPPAPLQQQAKKGAK